MPPGTRNGTRFRRQGYGVRSIVGKERGDLYVRVEWDQPPGVAKQGDQDVGTSTTAPHTFQEDLEDIKKAGFWVALILSLPTLTLPTIIGKAIHPGTIGASEVQTFWEVLARSAPLTAGVAISVVLLCFVRINKKISADEVQSLILLLIAIFIGTTALAN
jgi:hypothetical protein